MTDVIEAAAQFLNNQPGAVERILNRHRIRADGMCGGCFQPLVRWPCSMASIALRARSIRQDP